MMRPVHVLGIEIEDVSAPLLGVVHGRIGLLDQLFGVGRVARKGGDADAAVDRHRLLPELDRLRERGQQLLRDHGRVHLVGEVREQHRELVAAQATGGVGFAQAGGDAARQAAQQPVAYGVAQAVVDRLESVEIHEQHGQLVTPSARGREGLVQAIVEQGAVCQARQLVVGGQVPRSLPRRIELEDHAVALERGRQRRDQQPRRRVRAHQVAAGSVLERADRDGLVVEVAHHHDWNQGRGHARLSERRETGQVALAHVEHHHVDAAGARQREARGQVRCVLELESHRARPVQQRPDVRRLLGIDTDQQQSDPRRACRGRVLVFAHGSASGPTGPQAVSAGLRPVLTRSRGSSGRIGPAQASAEAGTSGADSGRGPAPGFALRWSTAGWGGVG
jgi:hypothetical protein